MATRKRWYTPFFSQKISFFLFLAGWSLNWPCFAKEAFWPTVNMAVNTTTVTKIIITIIMAVMVIKEDHPHTMVHFDKILFFRFSIFFLSCHHAWKLICLKVHSLEDFWQFGNRCKPQYHTDLKISLFEKNI